MPAAGHEPPPGDGAAPEPRFPATVLAGIVPLLALTIVWSWWAAKEGAYFGTVMFPGIIVLCVAALLLGTALPATSRPRLALPARISILALAGLGAWSALSALWSPAPDVAIEDAIRILGYALAFGLGLWLCALLRERVHLAMAPLAVAGLVAGALAVVAMLSGEDVRTYLDRGTLEYPIGYRNANAAFFLIAFWPALILAATRALDWRLRALSLAAATLSLELAMLSQSRGAIIGGAAALAVFLVVSRERARAVGWLTLAVLPALITIPALTDLFEAARQLGRPETEAALRDAARATIMGAGVALLLGAAAVFAGRRISAQPKTVARANIAVALAAVAAVLAGAAAFVAATGDPIDWISDRAEEFRSEGTPNLAEASSRFGVNAGSERYDLWRVALEEAGEHPFKGGGAGGYHYTYLLERSEDGIQSVRDAHSVEMEILSELGIPGLVLFLTALASAAVGALRARGLGPSRAALTTCAATAAAYWLAHASIDWFWAYAGVTAPVFALLGSAQAPAATPDRGGRPWPGRALALVTVVLALAAIPPFLAQRYLDAAFLEWRSDPERAQQDLDRARDVFPLSIDPLLAEGAIAFEAGDRRGAIAAFEETVAERPQEWAPHYFLARLHRSNDPQRSRAELRRALELNPLSARLRDLDERIRGVD